MNKPNHALFCSNHHAIIHADFLSQTMSRSKAHPSLGTQEKVGFNPIGFKPLLEKSKQLRMIKRGEVITAQFCDHSTREVLKPIWDAIRCVIANAMQIMARPTGVIVRFTLFTNSDSPSKVIQRVVERLKRIGSACLFWVREVRPEDYEGMVGDYEHYHAALLFDKKVIYVGTIIKAFDTLKARHWIESYHLSREPHWMADQNKRREQIKVHNLSSLDGIAAFEKHAAYLAKVKTKEHCRGKRAFGSSRMTQQTEGIYDK